MNSTSLLKEKLSGSVAICKLHIKRLNYAINKISSLIPLTLESYRVIDDENIQALDQFIFRFIKLQDELGSKTFRLLLLCLGEDVYNKPFLDILSLLEKYGIVDNEDTWNALREIRNELTHEYSQMMIDNINGINSLFNRIPDLFEILNRVEQIIAKYNLSPV